MFSGRSSRLAAIVGAVLLILGALALWLTADRGSADAAPIAPAAEPQAVTDLPSPPETVEELTPSRKKSKEEQRFARADRDDDGRITQAEYLHARRRNFDKLDRNGDGVLQFSEYAASGIEKFASADANRDGALVPAEFATTAPKPRAKPAGTAADCRCPAAGQAEPDGQD